MTEHKISFDRVKNIVINYIELGGATNEMFHSGVGAVLAAKRYLDGIDPYPDTIGTIFKMRDELIGYVRSADVRCANELISLVPQGADNRLPGWLYHGVVAELDDDRWILCPNNVEGSQTSSSK